MRYTVAYDIASDHRRNRLVVTLSGVGVRVQQSVFDCELDSARHGTFVEEVRSLVIPGLDRVRIVPICARCRASAVSMGSALDILDSPCWIV